MKTAVIVILALVGAGLYHFIQVKSGRAELLELQQQIAVLSDRLRESERRGAAQVVRLANTAASTAPAAVASARAPDAKPQSTVSPLSETDHEARTQIQYRTAKRAVLAYTGAAVRRLGLDAATEARIMALRAEAACVQVDTGAMARKAGITDSDQIRRLALAEVARVDEEIKLILGPDGFKRLGEEVGIVHEERGLDIRLSPLLSYSGSPFSDEQKYALARAVHELKGGVTDVSFPNADKLDSPAFRQATASLTPKQFEAFASAYRDGAEFEALALKKSQAGATQTAGRQGL